jgi:CRP/FNR family transcriptional regulator
MSQDLVLSRLQSHFPVLFDALSDLPASSYQLINAPAVTTIFDIGGKCGQFLLLTKGSVAVKMLAKSGKSILLYRVQPGQSCIITTSCLLGSAHYPTFGETETEVEVEALSIPQHAFNQALNQSTEFRQFVFDGLGQRLADVMQRLESVNFTSIGSRLAATLLARNPGSGQLKITHELLAEEVGTAREVVSRHLKKMEIKGLLKLGRGTVHLKDLNQLQALVWLASSY